MGERNRDNPPRETCLRCRRPADFCYCALLPSLRTQVQVLFLQHPRERHMPIGTARMAHLALPESTWVEGVALDDHPRITPLLGRDDVALLYPGPGARSAAEWAARPPSTLVVVDGTWWQAGKVLLHSPRLAALPRMALTPDRPSTYRIRKEPTERHLSTIEAVATTLGVLEADPERFAQLLRPFDFMIERQLVAQERREPRLRKRPRRPFAGLLELKSVLERPDRAVVIYAEANAHCRVHRGPGAPELVQLVAVRPATGERFESIMKPRRRLGERVAERLGLEPEALLQGEDVATFLTRWRDFLGADAELCAWGRFSRDLLQRETDGDDHFVDLRALTSRKLRASAGGIEAGAKRLCGLAVSGQSRRADRMLTLLEGILEALLDHARSAQAPGSCVSSRF